MEIPYKVGMSRGCFDALRALAQQANLGLGETVQALVEGHQRRVQRRQQRAVKLKRKAQPMNWEELLRDQIIRVDDLERMAIMDAMEKCDGNGLIAAKLLGIGKTTLYRKWALYQRLAHSQNELGQKIPPCAPQAEASC